jgi:hypothetical protein
MRYGFSAHNAQSEQRPSGQLAFFSNGTMAASVKGSGAKNSRGRARLSIQPLLSSTKDCQNNPYTSDSDIIAYEYVASIAMLHVASGVRSRIRTACDSLHSKTWDLPMRLTVCAVLVTACAALGSLPLSAQEAQPVGQACKADREKFCSDLKPGDGKMRDCIKQHASELSAECTTAMKAAREAFRNIRQECKPDAEKFCTDVPKGGGVMKCLESHASELQEACSTALKSRPGAKKA